MWAGRREGLILQRKRALKSQIAVEAEIGISYHEASLEWLLK